MEKTVKLPNLRVVYEGKDISVDVMKYLYSFKYKDKVEGGADSMSLTLNDDSLVWSNEWYANKGDKVEAWIDDMPCGSFEVDEIEIESPPRRVTIKALSIIKDAGLKTKKTKRSEDKTLRQLAEAVAKDAGLTLVGEVPTMVIKGVTQSRQTSLKFLRKTAWRFGIVFSIKYDKLVYTDIYSLEKEPPALTVEYKQMSSFKIKDRVSQTYKDCKVKYHDPIENKTITGYADESTTETIQNPDGVEFVLPVAQDTLVVNERVENEEQANAVAKANLYRANTQQQTGRANIPGNIVAVSGNNIRLTKIGKASGIYHMVSTTHNVTKSGGYRTDIEVKRIAVIAKEYEK